jgi:hypothetical protein
MVAIIVTALNSAVVTELYGKGQALSLKWDLRSTRAGRYTQRPSSSETNIDAIRRVLIKVSGTAGSRLPGERSTES